MDFMTLRSHWNEEADSQANIGCYAEWTLTMWSKKYLLKLNDSSFCINLSHIMLRCKKFENDTNNFNFHKDCDVLVSSLSFNEKQLLSYCETWWNFIKMRLSTFKINNVINYDSAVWWLTLCLVFNQLPFLSVEHGFVNESLTIHFLFVKVYTSQTE